MSELKLCYWNLRGLGEPIVLMLEYLGVKYNYKRYEEATHQEWFEKDKPSFQGDFANLPYLVDGDKRIAESMAIMRYLGRKFKALYPVSEEEERKCDVAQGAVSDFRTGFSILVYGDDYDKRKDGFVEELPNELSKFEKVLSKHTWLTGDKLMYIDFAFGEILSHIQLFSPESLKKSPKVKNYLETFEALDKIATYKTSEKFQKYPVNGSSAHWGGQK